MSNLDGQIDKMSTMAYSLAWYQPDVVLHLTLDGHPTVAELQDIDQEVTAVLNGSRMKMRLLIDAANLKEGYQTANHLRDTQKYMNHPRLERILVVSDNKLNRLVTLLAFCVAHARFVQFENLQKAEDYLKLL